MMTLKIIPQTFSICQVADYSQVDLSSPWTFIATTDQERSLVCPTMQVPATTLSQDDGWRAFRIEGVLDFSLIGILARIAKILADHQIGIFAISTYNTDYILTKTENFDHAIEVLQEEGEYQII